jgi:hypothetical protein
MISLKGGRQQLISSAEERIEWCYPILPKWLRWTIAAFYAYGAWVHLANMLGWTGIDWLGAPLKWQILDLIYIALDCVVVWGMVFRPAVGVIAFVLASVSQVFLYTVFREWILAVPAEFAPTPKEAAYLGILVAFHVATLLIVVLTIVRGVRNGANRGNRT